ncbi:MAG: hypothetical protein ACRDMV_03715 [Streptosporangiales bacterium]
MSYTDSSHRDRVPDTREGGRRSPKMAPGGTPTAAPARIGMLGSTAAIALGLGVTTSSALGLGYAAVRRGGALDAREQQLLHMADSGGNERTPGRHERQPGGRDTPAATRHMKGHGLGPNIKHLTERKPPRRGGPDGRTR